MPTPFPTILQIGLPVIDIGEGPFIQGSPPGLTVGQTYSIMHDSSLLKCKVVVVEPTNIVGITFEIDDETVWRIVKSKELYFKL